MIPSILSELKAARERSGLSLRKLCGEKLAYSTVLRWQRRARKGQALLRKPGPKKLEPLDWARLQMSLRRLAHGRCRTRGTTELCRQFSGSASRREVQALDVQIRREDFDHMKRIQWSVPNLAWAIDATEYDRDWFIIPVFDLASRYRFEPLLSRSQDSERIALFLEKQFQEHGAPLFLKRDNGSPFNAQAVDQVMARHWVLPLNNPPRYPRYNGAMEKCIRDLKSRLAQRLAQSQAVPLELLAQVEPAVHHLNHEPT